MMSIFDQGARLVPAIVTEAEEQRILLRIADAPWLTDLSRRVQHYGYRYDYRARNSRDRHQLSAPALAPLGRRQSPTGFGPCSTAGGPNSAS